jgi:dTDP-4-amino-4,6-dideoxygalactose transaminase
VIVNVNFLDLKIQHQTIRQEILKVVEEILGTAQFIGGNQVTSFEKEFAEFCGCSCGVGVNSALMHCVLP